MTTKPTPIDPAKRLTLLLEWLDEGIISQQELDDLAADDLCDSTIDIISQDDKEDGDE